MADAISRDEIRAAPGRTTYDRFLVYAMGPYKSFNLDYVLLKEELAVIDIDDLPGPTWKLFVTRDGMNGVLTSLRRV